jgi:ornithine cyclodeaminase/alanine dehydrogenase-like protein (mu-crystallin family)
VRPTTSQYQRRPVGLRRNAIIEMSDLINGRTQIAPGQAVVFKSTGMSWEDLVVADAVMTRRDEERN